MLGAIFFLIGSRLRVGELCDLRATIGAAVGAVVGAVVGAMDAVVGVAAGAVTGLCFEITDNISNSFLSRSCSYLF